MPPHDSSPNRLPVTPASELAQQALTAVGLAVERLRFGVVQLTVHDGKVVQLDVTERQRF
jgi:hypothetical protein